MDKENKGVPNFVITSGTPNWDKGDEDEFYKGGAASMEQGVRKDWTRSEPAYAPSKTQDKSNKKPSNMVIAMVLVVLLSVGSGFGGGYLAAELNEGGSSTVNIDPSDDLSTTEAVAAKALPSVVGITSVKTEVVNNDFFFGNQEQQSEGVGTGIIVDASGYILTNSHVVMDGDVDTITVLLSDGREVEGSVLWNDASLDLAIVKIKADNLQAAELGDSDDINIGSYTAAIGNPLGLQFASSVTQGVVSGLDRTITASSDSGQTSTKMEGLLQVDAAINSGNSGGPLLNSEGQVIGINTAKAESGEGMGFAIPINTAKPIIEKIKETGEFNRVYIGVSVVDLEDMIEQYSYMDFGAEQGAYIDSVTSGSPSEAAGLQSKDIIVELDGREITSGSDLINMLLNYSAGDKVEVKYLRDGKEATTTVTLTESINTQ